MIDAKTTNAVGELVQTAAHHHGLTGPVEYRILSEPGAVATGLLNDDSDDKDLEND